MTPLNPDLAPTYRYYTVDLMSNRILTEIPFRGVSWERTLGGAGQFQGKIPTIQATTNLDLYETTMPGQTALYVMRDGVCVWGGIIWARSHSTEGRELTVSASEFPSYYYHRRIWKTWSHEAGGTLLQENGSWVVAMDNGSSVLPRGGSTIKLQFFDPSNMKYDGYYRVASSPAPTTKKFALIGGAAVADIKSYVVTESWVTLYTKEIHGYSTGDSINVSITSDEAPNPGLGAGYSKDHIVDIPSGQLNVIRFPRPGGVPMTALRSVDGITSRPIPAGSYTDTTVTVRLDAADYIRSLLESVANDFVGTEFPNVYIEPGISYPIEVDTKAALLGTAIIGTTEPHGLSVGQAVQIQDVHSTLDGEWEVGEIISPTAFSYTGVQGTIPNQPVSTLKYDITKVALIEGTASFTTAGPHNLLVGQTVSIEMGEPYQVLSGAYKVSAVPNGSVFHVYNGSLTAIPETTIPLATATVPGRPVNIVTGVGVEAGAVTVHLKNPVEFSVGNTMTLSGVSRSLEVVEKSYDAPNDRAIVRTKEPHGLPVGASFTLAGLRDTVSIIAKNTNTSNTTFTTSRPHNLLVGSTVNISGLEYHTVKNIAYSGGTGTITTVLPHNIPVNTEITVNGLPENRSILSGRIVGGVAELTLNGAPSFPLESPLSITGTQDEYSIITREVLNGVVTLTLSTPHNILERDKITVSGLGEPFDGTDIYVESTTTTRVSYNIPEKYFDAQKAAAAKGENVVILVTMPEKKVSGTVVVPEGFYNGEFVVSAISGNVVKFLRGGEDQPSRSLSGTAAGTSPLNGVHTVSARGATTLTIPGIPGSYSAAITVPVEADAVLPEVALETVHSGNRVVTNASPTTFTVVQTLPSAVATAVSLSGAVDSRFNGAFSVTSVPTSDSVGFSMTGLSTSMFEQSSISLSVLRAEGIYAGAFTITEVDDVNNTVSYAAPSLKNFGTKNVVTRGSAVMMPLAIVSTFGPFPGNGDIGIRFDTQNYSGINIEPALYRSFELKSVGSALDDYANNINGFEYRIDCGYDAASGDFTRTFVMLPINYPNPPAEGQASEPERFGADRLVFEYPGGNITTVEIDESAEESATRYFVSGESDLGADVGPNIGIATDVALLRGDRTGRRWPLMDATDDLTGVDDEDTLYDHARRFLSDSAPPHADISITVNGSLPPFVGKYAPGQWCTILVDDIFAQGRLKSGLEPRSDFFLRKIASVRVSVPDGTTFPERVTLSLVPEWEIDKNG